MRVGEVVKRVGFYVKVNNKLKCIIKKSYKWIKICFILDFLYFGIFGLRFDFIWSLGYDVFLRYGVNMFFIFI